jgi:hypothetical protein
LMFACLRQQRAARSAAALTIQRHFRRWWAAQQVEQQQRMAPAVQHRCQVLLRAALTSWRGWVETRERLAQLAVVLYVALLPGAALGAAAGMEAVAGPCSSCRSSSWGGSGMTSDSDRDSDSDDLGYSCRCRVGPTRATPTTAGTSAAAAAVHTALYSRVKQLRRFLCLHSNPAAAAALRCEEGPWGLAAAHHQRRVMVKALFVWSWAAAGTADSR